MPLIMNTNLETRTKLIGISKIVAATSVATAFSAGSSVLSTEKDVRDTNKVQVLLPFLTGAEKIQVVLNQAVAGAVSATALPIGERTLELKNELITKPLIYRPRDTETLGANELLERYKSGLAVSATKEKDAGYFTTISTVGKAGLSTGEKMEIVEAKLADTKAFTDSIKDAVDRILDHEDGLIGGDLLKSDLAIGLSTKGVRALTDNVLYEIINTSDSQADAAANGLIPSGIFYGVKVYTVTKKKMGANTNAIIMVKGAATSQFLFKDTLNYDKVAGVNAYKLSLEFNEGTGVWLPQLITILVEDATANGLDGKADTAQSAVGSGTAIAAVAEASVTTSTKPV